MFHTLIELPAARLAIAKVEGATREAARAGCASAIEELARDQECPDPHTSKSHCGRWIAVGMSSSAKIGVDLEVARPRPRLAEVADWLGLDCADDDLFLAHWTLRESLAKCIGGSVLESYEHETELRAAAQHPGKLVDAGNYSALCGRLEGDIYYALVLEHSAPLEDIRCA